MMRPHPFLVLALIAPLGAVACSRNADEQARTAASEVRQAASRAGDAIADGWVTARVQARYFADDAIKARYIDVDTRDALESAGGVLQD